jgi:sirohydrochlorin cobaltochelatase
MLVCVKDAVNDAVNGALGLLVIGHGSRRDEANATLRNVARLLAADGRYAAVEAAFLELSEPSIEQGYGRLVDAGCSRVVAHPFFLFPGMHTTTDIPAQLSEAARRHPGATWTVTEPLGLHEGVLAAATDRIAAALASAEKVDDGLDQPVDPGLPGNPVDA